jgi:putative flavoprotein involved in K+ transport
MTTDSDTGIDTWLRAFDDALAAQNLDAVGELFAPQCFWRDMVAFTWAIHTAQQRASAAVASRRPIEDGS